MLMAVEQFAWRMAVVRMVVEGLGARPKCLLWFTGWVPRFGERRYSARSHW
jgi:hypothetical protein